MRVGLTIQPARDDDRLPFIVHLRHYCGRRTEINAHEFGHAASSGDTQAKQQSNHPTSYKAAPDDPSRLAEGLGAHSGRRTENSESNYGLILFIFSIRINLTRGQHLERLPLPS